MRIHLFMLALGLTAGAASASTELSTCSDAGFVIPDGSVAGQSTLLSIAPGPDPLVVVGARLELELEHPWVGDLVVRLVSPSETTLLTLVDRPGQVPAGFPGPFGCGGDDIVATLDDAAAVSIEAACTTDQFPVFTGELRPQAPLSGLYGVDPVGDWRIEVADLQSGDAGSSSPLVSVSTWPRTVTGRGSRRLRELSGDLDGDGAVDGSDLSVLLGYWGTANQTADLDGDGTVSGADLSVLLGNWGDCS